MMRKKHFLQSSELIKSKGTIDKQNDKVTVQYIQNPQLFQTTVNNDHSMVHGGQEDLEIENVEYLEDNANVEEYIEEPCEKDELEDNFYPNAIYCMLDLYKAKYESLITKNVVLEVAELWRDIAKDMQESFFEFNERQIQQKYASLREQYFGVQTKEDIENFDYFEQLHDIYKDLSKDNILKGFNNAGASSVCYKDEIFLQPDHVENSEKNLQDFKSEEIVHKEHEFIDMVEKELQAMEDGLTREDKEIIHSKHHQEKSKQGSTLNHMKNINISVEPQQNVKIHFDSDLCEEPAQKRPKLNEYIKTKGMIQQEPCCPCNISNNFSFNFYNQEQERRHREKMSLLEKSLQIQERALEQQQLLLQQLIKRLQS